MHESDALGVAEGGPPLTIFACTIPTEGAPSLRFLQEPGLSLSKGLVAMLGTPVAGSLNSNQGCILNRKPLLSFGQYCLTTSPSGVWASSISVGPRRIPLTARARPTRFAHCHWPPLADS